MNLIKVSTQEYPYTMADLRRDNPTVSFPHDLTGVDLKQFDVAMVTLASEPDYDTETQFLEPKPPKKKRGGWVIEWAVKKRPTPPPTPDWDGFEMAMATTPWKVAYDVALMAINPTLPSKLDRDFERWFSLYCETVGVTPEHRKEWAEMAEGCQLPPSIVEMIRG